MNARQLHAEMNRFQHVLSDLAHVRREAIEEHDGRLIAAILDLHREREDLLRRLAAMQAPLATMVYLRSLN